MKIFKYKFTKIILIAILIFCFLFLTFSLINKNKRFKELKNYVAVNQDLIQKASMKDLELYELLNEKSTLRDYDSPDFNEQSISVSKNVSINQKDLDQLGSQTKNWAMVNFNYDQNRYYPEQEINVSNVNKLKLYKALNLGVRASNESSPLVVNGVMYISTAFNNIYAFDAKTGDLYWHYKYKNGSGQYNYYNCCGPNNRGLAIKNNKIIMATLDAHLVCLDAKTGKLIWISDLLDKEEEGTKNNVISRNGYGGTAAPVIFENKILIGCIDGDFPIRGFMKAFDLDSGKILWNFYTIPKEGHEGTWQTKDITGHDLHRDIEKEKQAFPKHKNNLNLGGGIWSSPSVDIKSRTIFFTTGNPYPDFDGAERPGDNLYTNSILALNLDSGRYKWHMQYIPHDTWDLDFAPPTILVNLKDKQGQNIPAVLASGKIGNIFFHDRRDGKLLRISEPMIPQNLWNKSKQGNVFDMNKDGTFPDWHTGVSWSPMAYSEKLKYVYAMNGVKEKKYTTNSYSLTGRLVAIDTHTGKIVWKIDTDESLLGAPLVTAGNLVFFGEGNGKIHAVNATTGKKLWAYQCDGGANGGFSSYKIENKQYIAITCGGNTVMNFKRGNKVHIFSLPDS